MPLPRCPAPPVRCAPRRPRSPLFRWPSRNCRSTVIGRRTDQRVAPRLAPGADSFHDRDGGADAAFDIEIGIIQDMRVGGRLQGGRGAVFVPLIALENIGKYHGLVDRLATRAG